MSRRGGSHVEALEFLSSSTISGMFMSDAHSAMSAARANAVIDGSRIDSRSITPAVYLGTARDPTLRKRRFIYLEPSALGIYYVFGVARRPLTR